MVCRKSIIAVATVFLITGFAHFAHAIIPPDTLITLTGTITADSATGPFIGTAKIVLQRGNALAGSWFNFDSTLMQNLFVSYALTDSLSEVLDYRLIATAPGFHSDTSASFFFADPPVHNFILTRIRIDTLDTLTGIVANSAIAQVIPGAHVVLQRKNGTALTFYNFDSTQSSSNGAYEIDNLEPASASTIKFTYRLIVAASGFQPDTTGAFFIGAAGMTIVENAYLVKNAARIAAAPAYNRLDRGCTLRATEGALLVSNMNYAGMIKVFDLSGKLLFQCCPAAHATRIPLPSGMAAKSGTLIVAVITQSNMAFRQKIILP